MLRLLRRNCNPVERPDIRACHGPDDSLPRCDLQLAESPGYESESTSYFLRGLYNNGIASEPRLRCLFLLGAGDRGNQSDLLRPGPRWLASRKAHVYVHSSAALAYCAD